MANEEEISWSYSNGFRPCLGIRLKTESGEEYPPLSNNEKIVKIDTGYEGEIILPRDIYYDLGFNRWEKPDRDAFELGDGSIMEKNTAQGLILIPKLNNNLFPVIVHSASDENQDSDEILIGNKFIKRFRLLLDGPAEKACLV